MVDIVYFMICFGVVCFCCMWIGWVIGYADAKKKYRGAKNEQI